MSDPVAEAFRADLRCAPEEAHRLAERARRHLRGIVGSDEDSSEDLVYRLRDPRTFGGFAASLLRARDLDVQTRVALAERAFDLLPLPRAEGDVILVEARAHPRLLDIAAFLIEEDGFGVLPLMHLVFAVFLDRALLTQVSSASRGAVLRAVLRLPDASPGVRVLYAGIHLGTVAGREARGGAGRILRSRGIPREVQALLASILAAPDGGVAELAGLARDEGLLPAAAGLQSPEVIATIPRLPLALSDLGRRWLARVR